MWHHISSCSVVWKLGLGLRAQGLGACGGGEGGVSRVGVCNVAPKDELQRGLEAENRRHLPALEHLVRKLRAHPGSHRRQRVLSPSELPQPGLRVIRRAYGLVVCTLSSKP